MPNTFGHIFRITTFGESHGGAVGVIIDGCPGGYKIDVERIQTWLDRRRPGQSKIASPRNELDKVEILSGQEDGITLGTPLTLMVRNKDAKQGHYDDINKVFRPSHADYTTQQKFGLRSKSGGGRASARETIGRVAAAAVAEQILEVLIPGFSCVAYVDSVKDLKSEISVDQLAAVTKTEVEAHILRTPASANRDGMEQIILDAQKAGDTVGGTIKCAIHNVPAGLGDPVFDKIEADLAKAIMSLPACKGFEVGSGFSCTSMFGSEHNDEFIKTDDRVTTKTNRSGGIQGGITNGQLIYFNCAFKPVSTIFKEQATVTTDGSEIRMKPKAGRHDPCVLPRAVPMVEAMAILVVADHYFRQLIFDHGRKPTQQS